MTTRNDKDFKAAAKKLTGTNLKATREALGVTKVKFASDIGVTVRTIQNYESGEYPLPLSVRLATIDIYGIDPLSTEQLRVDLDQPILQRIATSPNNDAEPRWQRWRNEIIHYRKNCHTAAYQRVLSIRDDANASASIYFGIKQIMFMSGSPREAGISVADWILLGSFVSICCYFLWILIGSIRFLHLRRTGHSGKV